MEREDERETQLDLSYRGKLEMSLRRKEET
jgi:hypothetical protein